MNLQEYLNQSNPTKGNRVYLEPGEYIKHNITHSGNETRNIVEIPILHEKFGINGTYVQKNGQPDLYTHDQDGNALKLSCFSLSCKENS